METILFIISRIFIGLLAFACFAIPVITILILFDYFSDKIDIYLYKISEKFKRTKIYPVYKIIKTWAVTVIFILLTLITLFLIGVFIMSKVG